MRRLVAKLILRPLLFVLHLSGLYAWWCRFHQRRVRKRERKLFSVQELHPLPADYTSTVAALEYRLRPAGELYRKDPWWAFGDYWASPYRAAAALMAHDLRIRLAKGEGEAFDRHSLHALQAFVDREGLDCDDWAAYVFELLRLEPGGWAARRPLLLEVVWWDGDRLRGHHVCAFLERDEYVTNEIHAWHAGNWGVLGPCSGLRGLIESIVRDGQLVAAYASPTFPGVGFRPADEVVTTYWGDDIQTAELGE